MTVSHQVVCVVASRYIAGEVELVRITRAPLAPESPEIIVVRFGEEGQSGTSSRPPGCSQQVIIIGPRSGETSTTLTRPETKVKGLHARERVLHNNIVRFRRMAGMVEIDGL